MGRNDVLIQTLNSGISRGTESLVYGGNVPKSEHVRMQCPNQSGEFSFPLNYGYACTGKVIAIGDDVREISVGQTAFILHPHQSHFVVDEQWVIPLPASSTPQRGVLTANLETALNAYWDADIKAGETCAVMGAGVVGLLTAFVISKETGRAPVIVDINEKRKEIAAGLGLEFSKPETLADRKFDCILNTTASAKALQNAINHAAFEGRIIEMSWYGNKPVQLDLGGAFHSQRLTIKSSQVGSVAPNQRNNVTHRQRMITAMSYLSDQRLDALLTPVVDFESLPNALPEIFAQGSDALCPLVNYIAEQN